MDYKRQWPARQKMNGGGGGSGGGGGGGAADEMSQLEAQRKLDEEHRKAMLAADQEGEQPPEPETEPGPAGEAEREDAD